MTTDLPLPESCAHDGIPARDHVQLWREGPGWHGHVQPSAEVVLERTRALREAAAVRRYEDAVASGLSDHEAREEGWPT